MADIDNEVFDNGDEVAIKKVKKPRKPMSLSKKAAFAARMKASREAKKAAKAETKKVVKSALVEVGLKPVEVVEEVQAKQPVKRKRNVRHVPNELDSHMELINNLKADIAEMKTMQSSRKDLEEIKALKSELKAIRAQKRKEEKTKDIVVKVKEEVKKEFVKEVAVAQVKEAPVAVAPVAPAPVQKPRYSTYKKSIWSKLL